jgi:two-component sensor histidine kinase
MPFRKGVYRVDPDGVLNRSDLFALHDAGAPEVELTPELRSELLDPAAWEEILELYAHTMKLAVALVDVAGHMVGACHNPQPIWTLARSAKPASVGACHFCLEVTPHCNAALEAFQTHSPVVTDDQAGFAHVASPLTLGNLRIGTVLTGQVLDQYPESLSIQRLARAFGLFPQQVWNLARQQVPLGRANLTVYGELLRFLSQAFLYNRYYVMLDSKSTARTLRLNEQLRRSVAEKDILLKEVHHRVRNNLQVVSSLLNMQGLSLSDQQAVAALQDTRARVLSMAVIHEQLYSTEQWEAINFEEYCKRLVGKLLHSFGTQADGLISRFETSPVLLSIDQAIPCGLILSELVTNVLKYAYPGGVGGQMVIALSEETATGMVTLSVSDDGAGLPAAVDPETPESMGLEMVSILASQLEGVLTVQSNPGTRFSLKFPREPKERSFTVSA